MSVPISTELLVTLTGQPASELKALMAELSKAKPVDLPTFTEKLVEQGWLTEYQAEHVREGRGEGLLVGQYIVLKELGHGSVGLVYKACHRIMGRLAALKVFTPDENDTETHTRFMREIHATAQLDHPHLIKAYEAGEHHGAYFLAMELVDGSNLHELVDLRGPLPFDLALDCHLQAAKGLSYAHSLGMVHRDIKPGNIMLGKDGRVRVLDLGLVKFTRGISSMGTSLDGTVRGTAAFISPEQAMSIRNADHRSDIYSLGSSLYFALTGEPMYPNKTVIQQLLAHQKLPAPSLLKHYPDLPVTLERLYQRMVAKDPQQRLQTMNDVIAGLQAVLDGTPLPEESIPEAPAKPDSKPALTPENKVQNPSTWKRLFPFWREKS